MKATDINLREVLKFHPEDGKVLLGAERMLIFRQHALSTLRHLMYDQLGKELSRSLLSRFGYQCGCGDYETLVSLYDWDTDTDKLASGPVMHSWEGIVRATPHEIDYDRATGHFYMTGEWAHSYEAEIHVHNFGIASEPVCHSLTGYASGWATYFFGHECVAIEPTCAGKGDDVCRFEIRDAASWGPEADPWKRALQANNLSLMRELESKLEVIGRQQTALQELTSRQRDAIQQLATPILEIWKDVLVLPIVGALDTERSLAIMDRLLGAISGAGARCAIIDITGVDAVDAQVANDLLSVVKAAGLLGAHCVITGVSPAMAQTLVRSRADLAGVTTKRDLQAGLLDCLRFMGVSLPIG